MKFEHTETFGFEHAVRGMRFPFKKEGERPLNPFTISPKDRDLCQRLNRAGTPHNKFMRQIVCFVDITAPLYWWRQFSTYRVGVEMDSESTMHTILQKPFTDEDFGDVVFANTVSSLNTLRDQYFESTSDEERAKIWRSVIANLPQSYLQKRGVMMSYQALRQICAQRKGHKLSEWAAFRGWAKGLPQSWLLFDEEDT